MVWHAGRLEKLLRKKIPIFQCVDYCGAGGASHLRESGWMQVEREK